MSVLTLAMHVLAARNALRHSYLWQRNELTPALWGHTSPLASARPTPCNAHKHTYVPCIVNMNTYNL